MSNHTHTQYTSILCGNPMQEKNMECFLLYVFNNYIHWKNQLPLFSSCNWKEASTPQFLRLQPEGSCNSPILWLQPERGYNPLCSPTTTGRWLQQHFPSSSNHPEVEVELWNHCQPFNVIYTAVQLYQPVPLTCIQYVQLSCNQFVPELNMYPQKYNRYVTCSDAACICMHPICYAACVCLLKLGFPFT